MRAFEFLGGVPEIVVPDNLKSGVTKACAYEPVLNQSYKEMAQHYGVAIIPARVAKPRDKAVVENHVLNVERRVLAPLRDWTLFSLDEANQAISVKLGELNARPFQQLKGSRRELFSAMDSPLLRPLPRHPYEFGVWKKARVAFDYHVCVEHCFSSVPYSLVSQEVDVRLSPRVIEIFHGSQRVASHARSNQPNQQITLALHMPVAHQAYQDWTPERLVKWARNNGPATTRVVAEMMGKHPRRQEGFRSCLGVMKLAREFGSDRCEAACARALLIGSPCYQSIRSILTKKLDQTELPAAPSGLPCPEHLG